MNRPFNLLGVLLLTLTAACSALPGAGNPPATATATPGPAATPTVTPEPPSGPLTLEVWVPPQFDPAVESDAAALFRARLAEFSTRHPGVRVTVRVKAVSGSGGLLESLTAAAAAAPLALPDLVALPPDGLDTAASRGLIQPLDEWLANPDDDDWYPFAAEFARIDEAVYGLPFAADILTLAYRPSLLEIAPVSWAAALEMNGPLAFAAANPEAPFTLALYMARGGAITDEDGRVTLEQEQLQAVFAYYEEASQTGLMPVWLTQNQETEQTLTALGEGRAPMGVVWMTDLLQANDALFASASLPTHNGQPFTLASGWAWALAGQDADRHAISVELAEFLTAPEFMQPWTRAAGVLPPRPSALQTDLAHLAVAAQSLPVARLLPAPALLDRIGPALANATVAVLKQELSAADAAAQAVDEVSP
ncbi:MAG: extracellular solute-binding protein [Anaerolineae bacterium]|nr:MAG: extracellular solute-binding protein [Anaerolineae bacterium]